MKIFLDTADISSIQELNELGIIDGVTTNPTIIAKSGRKVKDVIIEICNILGNKDISVEVLSTKFLDMEKEAKDMLEYFASHNFVDSIVIKLPLTADGLRLCNILSSQGIKVNMTLCFSLPQALLAAKVGATYISPFVGRIDDMHGNGMDLIEQIVTAYDVYDFDTQILVASIRHTNHLIESAILGADVVTLPPKVCYDMIKHPLTDKGLDQFILDAQSIAQD